MPYPFALYPLPPALCPPSPLLLLSRFDGSDTIPPPRSAELPTQEADGSRSGVHRSSSRLAGARAWNGLPAQTNREDVCPNRRKLQPGDVCYSTVVPNGNDWERLDYSRDAWKGPPKGALGFWRSTVPLPIENKRRLLDPNALMRHFEQLSEDANPAQEKFRYVLALLLVQRRRLR